MFSHDFQYVTWQMENGVGDILLKKTQASVIFYSSNIYSSVMFGDPVNLRDGCNPCTPARCDRGANTNR